MVFWPPGSFWFLGQARLFKQTAWRVGRAAWRLGSIKEALSGAQRQISGFRSQLNSWLLPGVLPDNSLLAYFLFSVPAFLSRCILFVQFTALRNYKYTYLFLICISPPTIPSMKARGSDYLNRRCRKRSLAGFDHAGAWYTILVNEQCAY